MAKGMSNIESAFATGAYALSQAPGLTKNVFSKQEQEAQETSVKNSQPSSEDNEAITIVEKTKEDLDSLNSREFFPGEVEINWKNLENENALGKVMAKFVANKKSLESSKEGMKAEVYRGSIQSRNIHFSFFMNIIFNL